MKEGSNAHSYTSILAAAEGLLCEVVKLVDTTELEFVVIGGWSPYYLNNGPITHPGSRDVDLLFKEGAKSKTLVPAIEILTQNGFLHSAKHEFQMLRVLDIDGEKFVFNVDLLHADDAVAAPDMFADHVTLPIRLSDFNPDGFVQKSIKVPTSDFLFEGHVVMHTLATFLPNGSPFRGTVPLMDELGTMVTKAESMSSTKRRRDAFDILLAITQARDFNVLVSSVSRLRYEHQDAFRELSKLKAIRHSRKLRKNIGLYFSDARDPAIWRSLMQKFDLFLVSTGIT